MNIYDLIRIKKIFLLTSVGFRVSKWRLIAITIKKATGDIRLPRFFNLEGK